MRAARGLAPGFGVELDVPVRLVRDRIRFEDLARQPYVPPSPDTHHRNETLSGVGDPQLALVAGNPGTRWSRGARLGVFLPLGRTEDNPFDRGRRGLPHQHIQFGTGTFDVGIGAGVGTRFGAWSAQASSNARLITGTNEHGFRAGHRYGWSVSTEREVVHTWRALGGLDLAREEAETWNGRYEEEGNLGRTDLFLALGVSHATAKLGGVSLTVRVPLYSRAHGEQASFPTVFSLGWAR